MFLTFVGTAHCTFHGLYTVIKNLSNFLAFSTKFSLRLVKDSVIKIFDSLVLVSFFFAVWTVFRTDLQTDLIKNTLIIL